MSIYTCTQTHVSPKLEAAELRELSHTQVRHGGGQPLPPLNPGPEKHDYRSFEAFAECQA